MWWNNLSNFQQVSFVVAVTASVIMLIFLLLMIIGVDDTDFDGIDGPDIDVINDEPLIGFSGLRILTLRGILVLISMGAWTSFLLEPIMHWAFAVIIGVVIGAVSALLVALAFKASLKLESTGNLDYKNAIGKDATVYIRVPKNRSGKGKITLNMQERFVEVDAVTEDLEDLMPKTSVTILDVIDETTLKVTHK
ncbi:MAG: hypothetical protein EP317_02265 [Bacillota bacterium]|nr:MAG: hypothetical protein EP317_02265 [Bacillota bacterium]